jgi:hypothetical protein
MYRLLQSFRNDVFFGQEADDTRPLGALEKLTLRPPVERNVRQVREALEEATRIAFAGSSKNVAIEAVEKVLRSIAYPKRGEQPSAADRERAISFFRELVNHL